MPWRRGGRLPARRKAGAATRGDEFGEAPEAMFDIDIELRVLRSPLDYEFATHKGRAFLRTTGDRWDAPSLLKAARRLVTKIVQAGSKRTFKDSREIIREALSNSRDARASKVP